MLTFILRRILALIPLLFIVSLIVFGLVLLVPGDAATTLAGGEDATPERIDQVQQELGLDRPFLSQYGDWLGSAVQLDFGRSLYSQQPVVDEIWDRVPVTLQIAGGALVIGAIVLLQLKQERDERTPARIRAQAATGGEPAGEEGGGR